MPHLSESIVPRASASTRTIALVTDKNDWHARTLGKAFAALGAQTLLLKLPACGFDTATAHGLCLPDFDLGLPDAVLVRDMAGGTFRGGDTTARHPACFAGNRHSGLERRAFDRTLRGQVRDKFPACARRLADADDLGHANRVKRLRKSCGAKPAHSCLSRCSVRKGAA